MAADAGVAGDAFAARRPRPALALRPEREGAPAVVAGEAAASVRGAAGRCSRACSRFDAERCAAALCFTAAAAAAAAAAADTAVASRSATVARATRLCAAAAAAAPPACFCAAAAAAVRFRFAADAAAATRAASSCCSSFFFFEAAARCRFAAAAADAAAAFSLAARAFAADAARFFFATASRAASSAARFRFRAALEGGATFAAAAVGGVGGAAAAAAAAAAPPALVGATELNAAASDCAVCGARAAARFGMEKGPIGELALAPAAPNPATCTAMHPTAVSTRCSTGSARPGELGVSGTACCPDVFGWSTRSRAASSAGTGEAERGGVAAAARVAASALGVATRCVKGVCDVMRRGRCGGGGDGAQSMWCIFAAVRVARSIETRAAASGTVSPSPNRPRPSRHRIKCSAVSLWTKTVPSAAEWRRNTNIRPSFRAFASSTKEPSWSGTTSSGLRFDGDNAASSVTRLQRSEKAEEAAGPFCAISTEQLLHRITDSVASSSDGTWHTSSSRRLGSMRMREAGSARE